MLEATSSALTITALVVAYIQAGRTPRNTGNYSHWHITFDVGLAASSVSAVWRALVPIPALKHSYWNTNILSARAAVVGVLGLGAGVFHRDWRSTGPSPS